MTDNASERQALRQLAAIAPVVRGLLADSTGDQDVPYRPVILKSLTDEDAISFASSAERAQTTGGLKPTLQSNKVGWSLPHHDTAGGLKPTLQSVLTGHRPPMFLDPAELDTEPDKLRRQLADRLAEYSSSHGGKPQVVCLRGLGVLYVEQSKADPDLPLSNKVALVTGAAGAIGYGICRGLLEAGCHLVATDLPGRRLDDLTADLQQIGGDRVIGVPIDVTDRESVARGFETVVGTWGGVDVVVVNAGIPLISFLKDMDLDAFRKLEQVNVEGTLLTLAEAGRLFVAQGIGGDIIVISTKNVPSPGAGFGAYSATKAACHQLGRIASIELAQYGVRVNMVAPDGVFTEGKYRSGLWEQIGPDRMRARGLDEKGLQEYYRDRNLLKARITGRHVANAVLFFATRQTPTTGATIPVDGGLPDATPR